MAGIAGRPRPTGARVGVAAPIQTDGDRADAGAPAETQGSAAPAPDTSVQPGAAAKQAVMLIHGMGEQIPMDTIRGFVAAVWEDDPVVTENGLPNPAKTWSKPDARTGSLELRRITTRESRATATHPDGVRSDFYELYWADLTAGSTWDQLVGWVWYLLLRLDVPRDVRAAWVLLWLLTLGTLAIGGLGLVPAATWAAYMPTWLPQKAMIAIFAAAGTALHQLATRSFGRVVRYTRAQPDNIASRANVRARGLALLRALHDGSYDRIVVVGHSLGAILAYDLVSYLWAEMPQARTVTCGTDAFDALRSVEDAAARLDAETSGDRPADDTALSAYRSAQVALRRALGDGARTPSARWLVSDLVTFGAPLSHAEFLLAAGRADLAARQRSRELPTAPPYREELDPAVRADAVRVALLPPDADAGRSRLASFPEHVGGDRWTLHHAAPFAAVRWTNVFDPVRAVVMGDLIGGPVTSSFGPAVTDVDLSRRDRPSRRFTHTRYWALDQTPARLAAFREAVNLLDADDPRLGETYGLRSAAERRARRSGERHG